MNRCHPLRRKSRWTLIRPVLSAVCCPGCPPAPGCCARPRPCFGRGVDDFAVVEAPGGAVANLPVPSRPGAGGSNDLARSNFRMLEDEEERREIDPICRSAAAEEGAPFAMGGEIPVKALPTGAGVASGKPPAGVPTRSTVGWWIGRYGLLPISGRNQSTTLLYLMGLEAATGGVGGELPCPPDFEAWAPLPAKAPPGPYTPVKVLTP